MFLFSRILETCFKNEKSFPFFCNYLKTFLFNLLFDWWKAHYTSVVNLDSLFNSGRTLNIMKRNFKQWLSAIPPISTNQIITFHLNWTRWTQKWKTRRMILEIQVLTLDRHKNVHIYMYLINNFIIIIFLFLYRIYFWHPVGQYSLVTLV